MVLSFGKYNTAPEPRGHALINAQSFTKNWFQIRAKVEFLDVGLPIRFAGALGMLQLILSLLISSWAQMSRASGLDCVFVTPFVETHQDNLAYRVVQLLAGTTLPAAIRQVDFLERKRLELYLLQQGFVFV